MSVRDLDWEGSWNARDLGELPTVRGQRTVARRLVRSDALDALTDAGWRAALAHGVRTIIDLRNPDQVPARTAPATIDVRLVALEEGLVAHPAFVELTKTGAWATSAYLGVFLENWPERITRVLEAIAGAPPGGVVFHCRKGSDRTGVVSLALLAIAEVEAEAIVADYERTALRLRSHGAARGVADDAETLARVYEKLGVTPRSGVLAALDVWRAIEPSIDRALVAKVRARLT